MSTLIFDIETIGESWDELDHTTQHVLSRFIERSGESDVAKAAHLRDLKEGLGFSPLTGCVVAIGLYDLERAQGVVFYDSEGKDTTDNEDGEYVYKPRTEAAMLRDFWDGARSYDVFVTFNGRAFDVPFLILRSMVHGITPTRDLMEGRYLYQQRDARHVDLQEQLSFYGATHRKQPLHLYCRALGIVSPKEQGVSGDDVAGLFKDGKYLDIAKYNALDVAATTELYLRWREHLAPRNFQEES
jgi:DNA polymerase elongation subunit (family B)